MKKEEILKICTYYKGENKSPFRPGTLKDNFWIMERDYVNVFGKNSDKWESDVSETIESFPELEPLFKDKDIHKKGMLSCLVNMSYSHDPMGGVKYFLDYGK